MAASAPRLRMLALYTTDFRVFHVPAETSRTIDIKIGHPGREIGVPADFDALQTYGIIAAKPI
ncbi:MAG: hypothetical protein VW338_18855 [Rhodospirillaceae bacterium]